MRLIRKIKLYYLTGKYRDPDVKEIVYMFDNIFSDIEEYISDKYPKSMFFKYNNKIYFELDFKNDRTWCRYSDFWSIFKTKFGLKHQEIRKLTGYMLGMHLKRKVPPTFIMTKIYSFSLGIHLKRKVPPTRRV